MPTQEEGQGLIWSLLRIWAEAGTVGVVGNLSVGFRPLAGMAYECFWSRALQLQVSRHPARKCSQKA